MSEASPEELDRLKTHVAYCRNRYHGAFEHYRRHNRKLYEKEEERIGDELCRAAHRLQELCPHREWRFESHWDGPLLPTVHHTAICVLCDKMIVDRQTAHISTRTEFPQDPQTCPHQPFNELIKANHEKVTNIFLQLDEGHCEDCGKWVTWSRDSE